MLASLAWSLQLVCVGMSVRNTPFLPSYFIFFLCYALLAHICSLHHCHMFHLFMRPSLLLLIILLHEKNDKCWCHMHYCALNVTSAMLVCCWCHWHYLQSVKHTSVSKTDLFGYCKIGEFVQCKSVKNSSIFHATAQALFPFFFSSSFFFLMLQLYLYF